VDPEKVKAALDAIEAGDVEACKEILKEMVAAAAAAGAKPSGEAPPADAAAANADTAPPSDEESPETAALAHVALELTGLADPGAAIVAMREVFASAKKAKESAEAAELAEQRALITDLIVCGVEFPSTAWEGKPEDRKPVKRLADEPLESLRARVGQVKAARGQSPNRVKPPVTASVQLPSGKLSKAALAYCKKHNLTPEEFAARKNDAARRSSH
jgi:hypothetical protein